MLICSSCGAEDIRELLSQYFERARTIIERYALEYVDRGQLSRTRADSLGNLSNVLLTNDAEQARAMAERVLEIGRRLGI